MCIVELDQLGKRVLADDVAVEDEEGLAGAIYQLVSRQSQRPSRSQWLSLLGAGDFDTELVLEFLQEVEHHLQWN